jgi:hypothetical protein
MDLHIQYRHYWRAAACSGQDKLGAATRLELAEPQQMATGMIQQIDVAKRASNRAVENLKTFS